MGHHVLPSRCYNTVPTAALEASERVQVGAWGLGCTSRLASARASLTAWKAAVAVSVQGRGVLPLGALLSRSCRG